MLQPNPVNVKVDIVERTHNTQKLLLPGSDFLPVDRLRELTTEEAALRHRLELKVERALYRVAVGREPS